MKGGFVMPKGYVFNYSALSDEEYLALEKKINSVAHTKLSVNPGSKNAGFIVGDGFSVDSLGIPARCQLRPAGLGDAI